MDYPKLQFFLGLFNTALSVGAIIYATWRTSQKVVKARFASQDKRLDEVEKKVENMPGHCSAHTGHNDSLCKHKDQLTGIEGDLKHLPKVTDLKDIYDRINQVNDKISGIQTDVGKISGAMPGVIHVTEMMNEYLLKERKGQ